MRTAHATGHDFGGKGPANGTKPAAPFPSVGGAGGAGPSPAAGREEPHDSLAQPLAGPARPRYETRCFWGWLFPSSRPKSSLLVGWRWPRACFEASPLVFLLDKQLSGEFQVIQSQLLNGTPRARWFGGKFRQNPSV